MPFFQCVGLCVWKKRHGRSSSCYGYFFYVLLFKYLTIKYMKKSEKLIAFQTVDCEGDIWCNKALLFENSEKAKEFFKNPLDVLATLEYELEDNETIEDLNYKIHTAGSNDFPNCITFHCVYAGDVKIVNMSGGYFIN